MSVTIEANVKIVNFLDITLDLSADIYKPYMKDNDIPIYVNRESNHPPNVLKNIPLGINQRLSRISANEEVFNKAVPPYQQALEKSGFKHKLKFEPLAPEKPKKIQKKGSHLVQSPFFPECEDQHRERIFQVD